MTNTTDFKQELTAVADGERWGAADWDPLRGEHPPDETLIAYGEGRLDAVADGRVQEHLTTCAECRALVADLCAFPALEEIEGEPSEFEVAAAWRGVERRIAEAGGGEGNPWPRAANDQAPLWKRNGFAWTVAASFALLLLGSGVLNVQTGDQLATVESRLFNAEDRLAELLQPATGAIHDPAIETRSGKQLSAEPCVVGESCMQWVPVSQAALEVDSDDLRYVVVAATSGAEVGRGGLAETAKAQLESPERGFVVSFPAGGLVAGWYEIRLFAVGEEDGEALHRQRFEMVERSARTTDGGT